MFDNLKVHAVSKLGETAVIDYFATSLPNLLVFEEELQARRDAENHLLATLASHGLGDLEGAQAHLAQTLSFTNIYQRAADLAAAFRES